MKVKELFDHFYILFDTIVFYDETNNIQDTIFVKDNYGEYVTEEQQGFEEEYGNYDVVEWHYHKYDDIYLTIMKVEEEE